MTEQKMRSKNQPIIEAASLETHIGKFTITL